MRLRQGECDNWGVLETGRTLVVRSNWLKYGGHRSTGHTLLYHELVVYYSEYRAGLVKWKADLRSKDTTSNRAS